MENGTKQKFHSQASLSELCITGAMDLGRKLSRYQSHALNREDLNYRPDDIAIYIIDKGHDESGYSIYDK